MRLGVAAAVVDDALVRGDVAVEDGRIARVGIEAPGGRGIALPGLVDLQVNGIAGVDFLDAAAGDYRRAGEALLRGGVTAYRPTLISAPEATAVAALAELAGLAPAAPRVLEAHLEGPFLSPARLGAHPPACRRDPDAKLLGRLLAAGPVGEMTLAPELPGALSLVEELVRRGVVVSLGHSDASAGEAAAAFERGARAVTHLFNAMRPFQPRDPGIAGAALARGDVVVQLIVDGHHLAPETVRLAWRAARGRLALVSDAVAAAGMPEGTYRLGGVSVVARGGAVRRADDGRLAGSLLTMIEAVRNLHALGVPLEAAVHAGATVPARLAGAPGLGLLAPGRPADVLVVDEALRIERVLVAGREPPALR